MTREEAIKRFEDQLTAAVAVLDSGFGTRPGESDRLYRERKKMAEIALQALREQEENRWIPVTERLPEEKEIVLARLPHPVQRLNAPYYEDVLLLWRVKHNIIGGHSYIAWERVYGGETVSYNPTHWMRLPAPPKEETP